MARPKQGESPPNTAALARGRAIQAQKALSLRDLRDQLGREGHKVSIGALSEAGLAPDRLKAPPPAGKGPPAPPKAKAAPVVPPPPPSPPPGSHGAPRAAIDADGDPLAFARGLRRALAEVMAELDPDSGPYVKLSAEARQVNRQIAALEAERAGEETPDEAERRRRREDGETVKVLTQYADQAIAFALKPGAEAPHGRCPTCTAVLTAEGRAALLA